MFDDGAVIGRGEGNAYLHVMLRGKSSQDRFAQLFRKNL